jgi:hypothetical protein
MIVPLMDATTASGQLPEATIFFTPENAEFYSCHYYKPLDGGEREIRLLRVHPERLRVSQIGTRFPY